MRPDYVIVVQKRVLDEHNGPMLLHGLKELHKAKIVLPREAELRPDPARLALRYREFVGVG